MNYIRAGEHCLDRELCPCAKRMSPAVALVTYPRFLFLFRATNRHRQLPLHELPGGRINCLFCFLIFLCFLCLPFFIAILLSLNTHFAFPKHFSSTLTYRYFVEEFWSQLSVFMCYDKVPSSDRERESVVRSVKAPCVLNPCI